MIRYWYHPESDSLWSADDNDIPQSDGLVEEITKEEYEDILKKQGGQDK